MRIFGWAAERQGCWHYRLALPFRALADRGHDVRIAENRAGGLRQAAGSTVLAEQIRAWHTGVDVFVGQRVYLPGPSDYWQRMARARNRPLMVYEVDDDLLSVDASSTAHGVFADPAVRARIVANVQVADLVTVTTEYLASRIRPVNPHVVVLPNCVPDDLLHQPRSVSDDAVVVGWQGSSTHAMDWAELNDPLRQFLRRNPTVKLATVGADYARGLRLASGRWTHTGWVSDFSSYYRTLTFDVGLAPLRPHVFNNAKSPVKTLEYAALGIPTVASATGPYEKFVRHGETGFLVRRPHEWGRYLTALLDADTRAGMGAAARRQAQDWVISRNAHLWENAYQAALGTHRPRIEAPV